jgi:hypothetical protein
MLIVSLSRALLETRYRGAMARRAFRPGDVSAKLQAR